MAYDANLILQTSTNIVAAGTTVGPALSLRSPSSALNIAAGGTPRRGLKARLRVTACTGATQTVTFTLLHGDDGVNFTPLASPIAKGGQLLVSAPTAVITNAEGAQLLHIPFETDKAWVQLQCVAVGAAVNITFDAQIGIARP